MSDLARLLQQYGYAPSQNAMAAGDVVSTQDVLSGMPKENALANALRVAGAHPRDENGFLFSNVGGELKFNPWEAIKGFMSYRAPPGALSTSGDDAPVRNATDVAGWVGLSGLGLNAFGAVPANALGSAGARLAPRIENPIIGYHGSPHEFKPEPGFPLGRFKNEKIGTGEGAQAFGFGHYIAENESVARSYRRFGDHEVDQLTRALQDARDQFKPQDLTADNLRRTAVERFPKLANLPLETWQDAAIAANGKLRNGPGISEEAKNAYDRIYARHPKPEGHMYEVLINADRDKFIDWDKPLSQQSEAVRKALSDIDASVSGADAYRRLAEQTGIMQGKDGRGWKQEQNIAASEALREKGLAGIEYYDQGSRGSGQGTKNRVVFDPTLIEILRKYGLLGPVAAGATANALMGDKDSQ